LIHLAALPELKVLYLYRTAIRGPGLAHIAKLPKLEGISLSDTPFDDSGTKHLGSMARLTWARLDNTKVTDNGMRDLANAEAIRTLTLRNTEITDLGLAHLQKLAQLESLELTGTKVTIDGINRAKGALPNCWITATFGLGQTPDDTLLFPDGYRFSLDELNARLKDLSIDGEVTSNSTESGSPIVSLRLFDCTLSSRVILSLIKQMPELEMLNLRRGFVDDELLEGLASFGHNLRIVSLQATRITDEGLRHLTRLPHLTAIDLSETDVSDVGLTYLQNLDNVSSITLSYARVTSDGITQLRQSLPRCSVSW
jgi:Leucine-rich repeat (LRR) protein